jgi:D-3-phosphoglycerate dehydrogenase / 2-oxoglutarate reductase
MRNHPCESVYSAQDNRSWSWSMSVHVIAGAALDVLEQEPPDPGEPLLQLSNVIITPHTSSWSRESLTQLRRGTVQNVVDVLQDRLPRSVVNRKALGL